MFKFLKSFFTKDNSGIETALLNGAVVLDVRTHSEFQQGHLQGSKNIPLNEIQSKVGTIKKWNKPVIIVCRSGARSAAAKTILSSVGLEVYNGGSWTTLKTLK